MRVNVVSEATVALVSGSLRLPFLHLPANESCGESASVIPYC
jgi:hypothetical protein